MTALALSSKERVLTAVRHQEADRVPLVLASREISIRQAGLNFADIWADGSKYVAAQARLIRELDLDMAFDIWCNVGVDEVLGARVDLPADNAPWIPKPFIVNKEDISRLNLDYKLDQGRLPLILDVIRGLRKELGPEMPISAWISPPFRTAAMLRGSSQIYLDLLLDPGFAHELINLVLEPLIRFGRALSDAGADIICLSNPVANQDCIRRQHYLDFVSPYTKKLLGSLKEHNPNLLTMFHTCGRWDDRFDLVSSENVDILHVDKVDLQKLKSEFGQKITIMGRVSTVETLLQGTAEDVLREAKENISQAAAGGGYFLSASCTVPPAVPRANLLALGEAVRNFGLY